MTSDTDAEAAKDRERATWSAVAEGWIKYDRELVGFGGPVAQALVDRAGIALGLRVLDLASGTGEPALSIAAQVGPNGSVLATDLAEPMLAFARAKAAKRGLKNVEFRVADAETLVLPEGSIDAATMRWGLMFLPDPERALRNVHHALRSTGRVAVATWGPPEQNPIFQIPLSAIKSRIEMPSPPPGAPGLFAFSDPRRLVHVLSAAGFRDVATEGVRVPMKQFRTGAEYWAFQRALAGPIAQAWQKLSEADRAIVDREVAAGYERHQGNHGMEVPGLSWVAWGTK